MPSAWPTAQRPDSTHAATVRPVLRGDIEGLRTIAVMMVLLYHAGVPGLSGGFAGVDVFFVISGYLITGLLVKEATRDGRVSLVRFYARRARRLLPAASIVLATTALAGWWLLPRERHAELGTDIIGATGYVVNWVLARREVDYLAEDSAPSLVQHYWSLSVEEQFYVVWPLLIIAVLWAARRYRLYFGRLLTLCLGLLVVASLLWSVLHTAGSPGTAYFATTTRAWQLGVGALLVLVTPLLLRLSERAATLLGWAGLGAIGATLVAISTATPWPGSAALLPTLGTAAVIAAGVRAPGSPVATLLGHRPMRWIGALSYGLYLWHWPALRLLAEVRPDAGLTLRLLVAGLSILLAWASLHLIENPIRFRRSLSTNHRRTLGVAAISMLVTAGLGAALVATAPRLDEGAREGVLGPTLITTGSGDLLDGVGAIGLVDPESRADETLLPVADPSGIFTTGGEVYPAPSVATKDIPLVAYSEGCQRAEGSVDLLPEDACWFGDPEGEVTVALVGDSKMLQWLTALEAIAQQESWRLKVYTKSACGFSAVEMTPECHDYNAQLSAHLGDGVHTPDLLLTSMVRGGGEALGASVAGLLQPAVDAGARVVVLADNPSPSKNELGTDTTLYGCVADHPDNYTACRYTSGQGSGTPALQVAARQLDVPLIDMSRWVCPETGGAEPACPPVVGRVLVLRQGSHLTATYVASLAPILHHELVRAGVASTPLDQIVWELPEVGR